MSLFRARGALARFVRGRRAMRRPLLLVALPFLAGTLLWARLPVPWEASAAGAAACLLLGVVARRAVLPAVLAGALLLGAAAPAALPEGPALSGDVRIRGRVTSASGSRALVALDALAGETGPWRPARGRVEVVVPEGPPAPGTRLVAVGRARGAGAEALPGEPDPAIAARLARVATSVVVRRWVPVGPAPPAGPTFEGRRHAGLLRSLVVADRAAVPEETLRLFRRTGTSHLLSISGMNLVLVAGPLGFLAARLARCLALLGARSRAGWVAAFVATIAVLAYGGVARWPVSVARAAAMVAVGGAATAMERDRDPWNLLGGAALLLGCLDPGAVATAGWQLSFGALAGLLLVGPRLARLLPPDLPRPVRWAADACIATVAATCGTLPATAWWFQELAPACLPANLVAVPLIGAVATPGALLGAALPGPPGAWAATVADLALDLALAWLSRLDADPLHPAVGPAGAALLIGALLLRRRPTAAAALALVALELHVVPAGRLVVTVLQVGQGESVLVEWPSGARWLVDGGPSPASVARYLRRRGLRRLDAVVCTHPHPDHLGGLPEVISTLAVDRLWVSRLPGPEEEAYAALLAEAERRGVPIGLPGDPGHPAVWPLEASDPSGDTNDDSLVLRLALGRRAILLPADAGRAAEAAYAPRIGPVDVVVAPHHGSRSASSAALAVATRPAWVVVPCGAGNRFGHPHPEALAAWRGARILRTDAQGTVEISTDGRALRVRSRRPGEGWRTWEPGQGVAGGSVEGRAGTSSGSSASLASSRNR